MCVFSFFASCILKKIYFWAYIISLHFSLSFPTYLQTSSLLSFRFTASVFTNCYCMNMCICIHRHIPRQNLLSPMILLVCMVSELAVHWQPTGVCFPGEHHLSCSQLSSTACTFCVGLRSHGLFAISLASPLVSYLFSSHLDGYIRKKIFLKPESRCVPLATLVLSM